MITLKASTPSDSVRDSGNLIADADYAGPKLKQALRKLGKWSIEPVMRFDHSKGFELLPNRWAIEPILFCFRLNRRLAKKLKTIIASATPWIISRRSTWLARDCYQIAHSECDS